MHLSVKQNYYSTNYCIMLESNDGWIEYLGWNEFGALFLASTMELADKIAPKMGIEVNASTCFEEKPHSRSTITQSSHKLCRRIADSHPLASISYR